MSFAKFIIKFPEFSNRSEQFNAFGVDVWMEIERFDWGDLEMRAYDLLMAHYLSITPAKSSSDGVSSISKPEADIEEFEIDDDGFKVKYSDRTSSKSNYELSNYGMEYVALRDQHATVKTKPFTSTDKRTPNTYSGTRNTVTMPDPNTSQINW